MSAARRSPPLRSRTFLLTLAMLFFAAAAGSAFVRAADDDKPSSPPASSSPPAEFVPPADAKPAKRVGGVAIRCPVDADLYVSVLAPLEAAGVTTRAQPVVYW